MAVSVPLDFTPPEEPNIVALRIYESPAKDGGFDQIERTTEVGVYPNYITRYTTQVAGALNDWFAIQWEDAQGALSPLSSPVQGGTETLVNKITSMVMLRDPFVNENIAAQEAEAAIEDFFNVDPYTVDFATVTYRQLSGITLLALARVYLMVLYATDSAVSGYTAGLVQQTNKSTRTLDGVKKLIDESNSLLGRSYSFVALMEELEIAGGFKRLVAADVTRGIIEIA